MSNTKNAQNPTELLIWIYEDHQLLNLTDAPFGSGDMDALEEGIHDLVESLFSWKEKGNQFFEIDLYNDEDEEDEEEDSETSLKAGLLKCFDAKTGARRPFPTEWLRDNDGKIHVLNDPVAMEPLLKLYSNPWKLKVECVFTRKESPRPPPTNWDERTLKRREEFNQKEEHLIEETLKKLNLPSGVNLTDAKDVLAELVQKIRDMGQPPL